MKPTRCLRNVLTALVVVLIAGLPLSAQAVDEKIEVGFYGGLPFSLPPTSATFLGVTNSSRERPYSLGAQGSVEIKQWMRIYGDVGFFSLGDASATDCAMRLPPTLCPTSTTVFLKGSGLTLNAGLELQPKTSSRLVPFVALGAGFYKDRTTGDVDTTTPSLNITVSAPLTFEGRRLYLSGEFGGGVRVYLSRKFGLKAGVYGQAINSSGHKLFGHPPGNFGVTKVGVFYRFH